MASTSEMSDDHESAAQLIPWLINGTLTGGEADRLRAHLAACPLCRSDIEAEARLYELIRQDGPLVFPGESAFDSLMARIEADEFAAPRIAPGDRPEAGGDRPASGGDRAESGGDQPESDGDRAESGRDRRTAGAEHSHSVRRGASRRRAGRRPLWHSAVVTRWLAAAVVIEALGLGLGASMWGAGRAGDAVAPVTGPASIQAIPAPYRTLTTPAPRYGAGAHVRIVFRPELSLGQLQRILRRAGAHIVDGPTDARVYTLGFAAPLRSAQALDARIAMLRADPNVLFAEPAGVPP